MPGITGDITSDILLVMDVPLTGTDAAQDYPRVCAGEAFRVIIVGAEGGGELGEWR